MNAAQKQPFYNVSAAAKLALGAGILAGLVLYLVNGQDFARAAIGAAIWLAFGWYGGKALFPRMKNPKAGLLLSYRDAIVANTIEAGVRPLVDSLNREGVAETVASCEGHFAKRGFFSLTYVCTSRPYVLFLAVDEVSRQIARWLGLGQGPANELHFVWQLSGEYTLPECDAIQWCIEPNDVRLIEGRSPPWGWRCDPVAVAADLLTLAEYTEQIIRFAMSSSSAHAASH